MRSIGTRRAAGALAAGLLAAGAMAIPAASANPSDAVPFDQASFNGYATGDALHLGTTALETIGGAAPVGIDVAGLDQGFSSATTSTSGLTSPVTSEIGTLVQPAQVATARAYDAGAGLKVDLGGGAPGALVSAVQSLIPQQVSEFAPPNLPAVTDQLGPLSVDPVAEASSLVGEAQPVWDQSSCPTGDISYGLGELTASKALDLPNLLNPSSSSWLLSTAGNGTSVSQTKSETMLTPNGDGTYGLSTQASDILAPLTVNLLGLATLRIAVQSAGGADDPVTLTAKTTGAGGGASVALSTDDLLTATLTPVGGGTPEALPGTPIPLSSVAANGMSIPISLSALPQLLSQISLSQLQSTLQSVAESVPVVGPTASSAISTVLGSQPVTSVVNQAQQQAITTLQQVIDQLKAVINLNLGEIDIETVPHAIGGAYNSPATTVGGTQASGAIELLHLKLGLFNSSIVGQALPDVPLAGVDLLHLEVNSSQDHPIACTTATSEQIPTPTTTPPQLAFTGGPGGLWQPIAGLAIFGAGAAALYLVRRSRRRPAA